MAKFKAGDRVRLIKSGEYNKHGCFGKTGEEGVILRWDKYIDSYKVHLDKSGNWWAEANNLAPAQPAVKFKVGDMVSRENWPARGYAVRRVGGGKIWLDDAFGRAVPYDIDDKGLFVVADAAHAKTAIVALIENGQPKPADRPFVHSSRAAASKEARRLAGKHPGKEFGVYELVDTAKEAKVYKHEWQRLAAGGRKIDAIKCVRDATGFTLKSAKDAVEHWLAVEAA